MKPVFLLFFCALSVFAGQSEAAPRPAPLFGNGAVVARDRVTAIFGDGAAPGETVAVSLAGQGGQSRADENGRWRVFLEPLRAGGPYQLLIAAPSGKTVVSDVWVGDLWLCAGQSNMEMALSLTGEAPQIALLPEDRKLRILSIPKGRGATPQRALNGEARWQSSSAASRPWISAVAWHFANTLRQKTDVAVGIVTATWGGTSFQTWTPRATLQKAFPERVREFDAALQKADAAAPYSPPMGEYGTPTDIFNGMIAPLAPASFTGVVWYQGEQDAGSPRYDDGLKALIAGWRAAFDEHDLPFLVVQLPAFGGNGGFPALRAAQAEAVRQTPDSALIVTIDTGARDEIHPNGKPEIGRRAALAALALTHGQKIRWRAPQPLRAVWRNGNVEIEWEMGELSSRDGQPLRAFEVAGADGAWTSATASLDANGVSVAAPQKPARVRYAMQPFPDANLGTPEGLAVAPFELDVTLAR